MKMPWESGDEPWCHVLPIFSLPTRPLKVSVPIRWVTEHAAAQEPSHRTGPTGSIGQEYKTRV